MIALNAKQAQERLDKAIASREVMPIHALYNRVSIEHDIPIAVAEAITRNAGMCASLTSFLEDQEQARSVLMTFTNMWVRLAEPLHIPQERMVRAVLATLTGIREIDEQLVKLNDKVSREAKACA